MDKQHLVTLILQAYDVDGLLEIIAKAHPKMMAAAQWGWVVRADAAMALTPRSRTEPPASPSSATATPETDCTSA